MPAILPRRQRPNSSLATLFPYTTLFRSAGEASAVHREIHDRGGAPEDRAVSAQRGPEADTARSSGADRKSTRLNSSHEWRSYAVFWLQKKAPSGHARRDS